MKRDPMSGIEIGRFWDKVRRGADGECWEWTASRNAYGYGQFRYGGTVTVAHRISYELIVGSIPEGELLDHTCRNRWCVNPAHLEPVTPQENTLRGEGPTALNAKKIVCARGHFYSEENTGIDRGQRFCRQCRADRVAA